MNPKLEFNSLLITTAWVACGTGAYMCYAILSDGIRADALGWIEVLLVFCFGVLAFEGSRVIVLWRIHVRTFEKARHESPARAQEAQYEIMPQPQEAQHETPAQPQEAQRNPLTLAHIAEFPYRPQGYVYVIRDKSVTGYVKIGRTTYPARRLTDFGVKLPFEIEVLSVTPADHAVALESALHTTHREQRIRGEWFALDEAELDILLAYLDQIAKEMNEEKG